MVEGPGCKLNGEKLRKRAKGQVVKAISGNVFEKRTKAEKQVVSPYDKFIGKKLLDVKTLGKELFAIFEDDLCLRVHFLMNGSLRFNNEAREFGDGKAAEPRLRLHMSKDEVGFYDSAVELRSAAECIEKYNLYIDLDICSPTFDAKRAALALMEHPERLVCDVILDQLVLPGVGNIIKNEALFDAGINPNSKVKELNPELVSHLVKMNRDFTSIFYKCRKEGRNLHKFMRVYKKTDCPECNSKLVRCKLGEYERLTFFCKQCQMNTIRTRKKLPKKNSLLGWVEAGKNQVLWNCSVCTLENKPANIKCTACLTPKYSKPTVHHPGSSVQLFTPSDNSKSVNSHHSQMQRESSSSVYLLEDSSTHTPDSSQVNIQLNHLVDSTPEERCRIGKYKFRKISHSPDEPISPLSTHQNTVNLNSPISHLRILPLTPKRLDSPKSLHMKVQTPLKSENLKSQEDQILCSGHGKPAKKSVVEKKNENRGRIFYVCNMPMVKQCKFFMWGDDFHPFCNHVKKSVIRKVLKQNANNGREFYCCPLPKPKQCDFFQWVDKKA
ncbi:Nei endonuclease VIII-like 3 [Halocaridina rubra]|uniref:Endonuclease 8-like 3 n=1 Tax=Halocaridina rubra TaxID=373956 RepID=A0AAN9FU42_HALRR